MTFRSIFLILISFNSIYAIYSQSCRFTEENSVNYIDPNSGSLFSKNSEILQKFIDGLCLLDPIASSALENQVPGAVNSLQSFSNFVLLLIPGPFLSRINPDVVIDELSSDGRSTEVKVRLIQYVGQTDLFKLIANVNPIGKPESLAILSRTPRAITHLNLQGYNQMQLILTKGFRIDQLTLFLDSYQYRDYLTSIMTGIENGFKDEPLTCFESQQLLNFVRKMVGEVKSISRFAYDYFQSYNIWVKMWGQILPCVNVMETTLTKNRAMQVVDSLIKTNPETDFNQEMGSNLLFLFLQNAPSINTQNGENFAFDSVSNLWKYANYQHFRYIQEINEYSKSLKSPTTIYNMFSKPTSSVFTSKLSQLPCKSISCIGHLPPPEQEEALRKNSFKCDLIPVQSLSWTAKRQVASLVFSKQATGVPLEKRLRALGSLLSGVETQETIDMMKNLELAEILIREIEVNGSNFDETQKRLLIGSVLNGSKSFDSNMKPELWKYVSFHRFLEASKTIASINLNSIRQGFLNQAWEFTFAQALTKFFDLSLDDRFQLSIFTRGSWIAPDEIQSLPDLFDVFQLIQSVNSESSNEYAHSVAHKVQSYYQLKSSSIVFRLNSVQQPILASIPGRILRELPLQSFTHVYNCRELISKIGQLEDNYKYARERNQQLAYLFITNCENKPELDVEIDSDILIGMGNLVCYISPNHLLASVDQKVLRDSLYLFGQCCLSANQSAAIKENLLTNLDGESSVEYMDNFDLFCQIFDFNLNSSQMLVSTGNLISQNNGLSSLYEFVNLGGLLSGRGDHNSAQSVCAMTLEATDRIYSYEDCHKKATELILEIEPDDMKCATLKTIGYGIRWINDDQILHMSASELEKCLDYLGIEIKKDLIQHLGDAILINLQKSGKFYSTNLVQLKNILPQVAARKTENTRVLLDDRSFDVMIQLTNQNLSADTVWWLQNYSAFYANSENLIAKKDENATRNAILSMGSLICYERSEDLHHLLNHRYIGDLAKSMKFCSFEKIKEFNVEKLITTSPDFTSFLGNIKELDQFAYPLLINQKIHEKLSASQIQAVPISALHILPERYWIDIDDDLIRKFSLNQAHFVLSFRSKYLTSLQIKTLQKITRRFDDVNDFDDMLGLELVAMDENVATENNNPDVFVHVRQNSSEVNRYTHLIYIYGSSYCSCSNLFLIAILIFVQINMYFS